MTVPEYEGWSIVFDGSTGEYCVYSSAGDFMGLTRTRAEAEALHCPEDDCGECKHCLMHPGGMTYQVQHCQNLTIIDQFYPDGRLCQVIYVHSFEYRAAEERRHNLIRKAVNLKF